MSYEYEFKETLLTLDGVDLTLGERKILTSVNASVKNVTRPSVEQGQVIGILGPSGVGKTQLFRVLAGLTRPDCGKVLVGREQVPVERGRVGVVAQDYPLFWHRSVLDNLRLAARLAGCSRDDADARARELVRRFRLEKQADMFPSLLSGGQRQRAAIAQQLLRRTPLLLMDEPFSGLDPCMLREACALIREVSLHDELLTLVIVSHDVDAVLSVADTVWLLGRDRVKPADESRGARIVEVIDLMERGMAWREDVRSLAVYGETRREIEERFMSL